MLLTAPDGTPRPSVLVSSGTGSIACQRCSGSRSRMGAVWSENGPGGTAAGFRAKGRLHGGGGGDHMRCDGKKPFEASANWGLIPNTRWGSMFSNVPYCLLAILTPPPPGLGAAGWLASWSHDGPPYPRGPGSSWKKKCPVVYPYAINHDSINTDTRELPLNSTLRRFGQLGSDSSFPGGPLLKCSLWSTCMRLTDHDLMK